MLPGKLAGILISTGLSLTPVYFYMSPYFALNGMKSAAEQFNAEVFNRYVDYPALRHNLVLRFRQELGGNDLGLGMAGRLVDTLIQPDMVMKAMQASKKISEQKHPPAAGAKAPDTDKRANVFRTIGKAHITWEGLSLVAVRPSNLEGVPESAQVDFLFSRSGFATWRLTDIRMRAAVAP